jgi:hypothetical protein
MDSVVVCEISVFFWSEWCISSGPRDQSNIVEHLLLLRLLRMFPILVGWLQSQDTYTLHKPTRRRFPRRRVVFYGIDHQWQADLVDLAKLSSYNKGFKYLLICIDVLSRYQWVVPLTDKTGKTLKDAFPDPLNPPATGGQFHRIQRVFWEIVV